MSYVHDCKKIIIKKLTCLKCHHSSQIRLPNVAVWCLHKSRWWVVDEEYQLISRTRFSRSPIDNHLRKKMQMRFGLHLHATAHPSFIRPFSCSAFFHHKPLIVLTVAHKLVETCAAGDLPAVFRSTLLLLRVVTQMKTLITIRSRGSLIILVMMWINYQLNS